MRESYTQLLAQTQGLAREPCRTRRIWSAAVRSVMVAGLLTALHLLYDGIIPLCWFED